MVFYAKCYFRGVLFLLMACLVAMSVNNLVGVMLNFPILGR